MLAVNGEESLGEETMRNIVLIGFMGCGKTTLGHMIQDAVQYGFLDTDTIISTQIDQSIPDFFSKHGEKAFRELESSLIQQMVSTPLQSHVIATGGGIITSPSIRELLPKLGFVVWLTASPETIYKRTRSNSNRPLLNTANPKETISKMLQERTPLYAETAHLKLSTDDLSFQEIVTGILESASYYFGTHQPKDS